MSTNNLDPQQHHQMQLEQTHPSGAEEWHCPTCGRRFLLQWPPSYKRIVMEAGDEYAIHNACKGGLRMGPPQITDNHNIEAEPPVSAELRDAIEDALKDVDFDDWAPPLA